MEITYGKKFVSVALTMFAFISLTLTATPLLKILNPFELVLIGIILMIFSLKIGKSLSKILYLNINHFHRIECEKKIKEFIDYSIRKDTLYRPFFRDLEVPVFDSDNKKYGQQPLYSHLIDKNKEFNNK